MTQLLLFKAAKTGDVDFLKEAIASRPTDYFDSKNWFSPEMTFMGNIFHIALEDNKVEFFREAMEKLTAELKLKLLAATAMNVSTPLHVAASNNNLEIIKLILDFYKSYTLDNNIDNDLEKPWLVCCQQSSYPLYCALNSKHGDCALEILSIDLDLQSKMVDSKLNSALFLAVQNGCNRVALHILRHSSSFAYGSQDGSTALHVAPNSSGDVLRLLLALPRFLDQVNNKGFTVLHQWASIGKVWPLTFLLKEEFPDARAKVFRTLIIYTTEKTYGDTPLHTAARFANTNFGAKLLQGSIQEIRSTTTTTTTTTSESPDCSPCPWKTQNMFGDTPLHVAICCKDEKFALHLLSIDSTLCHILNNKGTSPLLCAVSMSCGKVIDEILKIQDPISIDLLRRSDGMTLLHFLPNCAEKIGKRLLEKFWWMMNLRDDKRRTALDKAKERDVPWLVNLLMNPSLIRKEPFDWIKACEKRTETSAVLAFIDSTDLQAVYREQDDTPLHHIKLQTYRDYVDFLKIPSIAELKNATDFEGATPLHRALQRKDIHLARVLLVYNRAQLNIKDNYGTMPMDLLAELCKENDNWAKMCKEIKINPYLRTSYIQPGTNMVGMRNTLSVVAALLATITFAAGFTLPGGLNQETGDAILAKKAAFLVFLLSDAYAMCTSMLVLFCLIWSMISTREMSYFLVDRSVMILMQALYGTMVAFMTGIYTVVAHGSLWATIVIFVMCSLIGITANRTVLHTILARLIPATYQGSRDQTKKERRNQQPRLLEEGKATESGNDDSPKGE